MNPITDRRRLRRLAEAHSELIDALNELVPNATPRLTDTDREVWVRVGERGLVEFLIQLREEARKRGNVLKD